MFLLIILVGKRFERKTSKTSMEYTVGVVYRKKRCFIPSDWCELLECKKKEKTCYIYSISNLAYVTFYFKWNAWCLAFYFLVFSVTSYIWRLYCPSCLSFFWFLLHLFQFTLISFHCLLIIFFNNSSIRFLILLT